jgi:chromosome partitioning protein
MAITAVVNQKGGVGKTATALNVAGALAERGRRVLLVDLDPQGHLSEALKLADPGEEATLAAALVGQYTGPPAQLVVEHSTRDNGGRLDAVPNTPEMFTVAREVDQLRAREHRLARVLVPLVAAYDHVVIDCPPSLDILTDNALAASDGVLIPVQAEDSSIRALELLLQQFDAVDRDLRAAALVLHGLVVNLLRRPPSVLARSVLDKLADLDDLPILGTIPQSVTVTEAWRYGQPVVDYAPTSEHAEVYRTVAARLEGQQ